MDRNGEEGVDRNGEEGVDRNGEEGVDRNGEEGVDRSGEEGVDRNGEWRVMGRREWGFYQSESGSRVGTSPWSRPSMSVSGCGLSRSANGRLDQQGST